MQQRDQRAVIGIEQQHRAAMRGQPAIEIVREYRNDLCADERRRRAEHHRQQPPAIAIVGHGQDLPHFLHRRAIGNREQRLFDQVDPFQRLQRLGDRRGIDYQQPVGGIIMYIH